MKRIGNWCAKRAWALAVLLLMPHLAAAAEVSFRKEIAPILFQKCHACHHADKIKGDYRLDAFERLMRPGGSGEVPVVAGNPVKSELFRLIASDDPAERMPQKDDPLSKNQIALIERWIREGAKFDGPDRDAPLASLVQRGHTTAAPAKYERAVPIVALAFSPDGSRLAASGYHEVTIWDAKTGALVGRVPGLPRQVTGIAYGPTGRQIVAGGGTPGVMGEVVVIDMQAMKVARSIARTNDMVYAMSLSADGRRVAFGGVDGAIRVHEVESGARVHLIEQHSDWAMALAFSPDGRRLLSGSRDKTARVFDLERGEALAAYQNHGDAILSVAFSADGKLAYSAGREKEIHCWNPSNGEKVAQISAGEGGVLKMVLGRELLMAGGLDRKVRTYLTNDRSALKELAHEDWVSALAFHEGSKRLATGTYAGRVHVWKMDDSSKEIEFIAAPGMADVRK